MFKINRKVEYALIALKHMQSKSESALTTAKEITEIYHTPFDPTSRVMQLMTQKQILMAEQGAKGGYRLIKDLNTLTMKELCDSIIGRIEIANCIQENQVSCDVSCFCNIIAPMLNLNDQINKLFENLTVSELLNSKHEAENSIQKKMTATSNH